MKNKRIIPLFITIVIIIAIVAVIGLTWLLKKPEPPLKRMAPTITKGTQISEILEPDDSFEASLLENIPSGTLIKFSPKGELVISPETSGKKGIFFTFAVKSKNKEEITTTIQLKKRKIGLLKLQKFSGKQYSHSFSRELTLKKSDEIIIEFQGNGSAVLNTPVIYEIIPEEKRKYIFAIALDTLRDDRIGTQRNGIQMTPSILKFKHDAAVFANTYAQSSWTLPSFTSFFTGLYEFNHQITRTTSLEKDKPLLMEQISDKFFTVNFNAGLWMEGKFGFSRGVDFFSVMSSPTDSYGGKVLFKSALDFLKKTNLPSVFMFLHTYQIHSPYAPPQKYLQKVLPDSKYQKLDSFFYKKQFNRGVAPEVRQAMEELYEVEIFAFDHFFQQFIHQLKELGIYDRSMIIFFSDHGEEFYEHKGWAHCHSLYNEAIKVPLFIKFPGNRYKGKVIKTNAGVIDILPTLIDFYHIDTASLNIPLDGTSLMPLLTDGKWEREHLFSSTSVTWLVKNIPPKFAVIKDNYKLIYNFPYSQESLDYFSEFGLPPSEDEMMVFDLSQEPDELNVMEETRKKSIMKEFIPLIKNIKEKIRTAMKRKRHATIHLTPQERKKLESLGYL